MTHLTVILNSILVKRNLQSIKRFLLPLAIVMIIPLMGLISQLETIPSGPRPNAFFIYLVAVLILYIYWHLSWHFIIKKENKWMMVVLPIVYFGLIHVALYSIRGEFNAGHLVRTLLPVILITIIQLVIKAQQDLSRLSIEKEQILAENYKSEIQALQTKIDPHFLFNSMSTLHSLVR